MHLILVLDDDPVVGHLLATVVHQLQFFHMKAATVAEAWGQIQEYPVDGVIADLSLPAEGGLELVRRVRTEGPDPDIPIVVCSGMSDRETVQEALEAGANDYVRKPVNVPEISPRLVKAFGPRGRWEHLEVTLSRLAIQDAEYVRLLDRARRELRETARNLADDMPTEELRTLATRFAGQASSLGNLGLARLMDRVRAGSEIAADDLRRFLNREAAAIDLAIRFLRKGAGPVPPL
jgi:CheY-like chemotaxis protein